MPSRGFNLITPICPKTYSQNPVLLSQELTVAGKSREDLLKRARVGKNESKYLDFKADFDPDSRGDWCEIVKDIVAMANTLGGIIVVGVQDNGQISKADVSKMLDLDPARVTDKIHEFTGEQFSRFETLSVRRDSNTCACLLVNQAKTPLIFEKEGQYQEEDKHKVAFQKGTMYFRHGAKSEPGTNSDIRNAIERRLESIRDAWLSGIRKVTAAPLDSVVQVVATSEGAQGDETVAIRVTDDPDATTMGRVDYDQTHPYRTTELVEVLNDRMDLDRELNQHDVVSVKEAYNIPDKPQFYHVRKHTNSPQYSESFVQWIIEKHNENPRFFEEARERYRGIIQSDED